MATFDGFFSGETKALETYLKTKYTTTGAVFRGHKQIGQIKFPAYAITWGNAIRDTKCKFGFTFEVYVTYVQQSGRMLPPEVEDEAEVVADHVQDHWDARNASGNSVGGFVYGMTPKSVNLPKLGFVNWIKITSKVWKQTDEGCL